MMTYRTRPGYVLLISVLAVGGIASVAAVALLLLGLSIERNAYSLQVSTQSYAAASSCVERAIESLKDDNEYGGNETFSIRYGYTNVDNEGTEYDTTLCTVHHIAPGGNHNRTVCAEALFGNFTIRRFEVEVDTLQPSTEIRSWMEVDEITACNPYTGTGSANCGNGTVNIGEECDDGDTNNDDFCSSTCLNTFCGDNALQRARGEECDDGGTCNGGTNDGESCTATADCPGGSCDPQAGDGCSDICRIEQCGNGLPLDSGEECDDGNTTNDDGCSSICHTEFCGDKIIQTGESCDDGGECVGGSNNGAACTRQSECPSGTCTNQDGDGCSSTCLIESGTASSPTDYISRWQLEETSDPLLDTGTNGYNAAYEGTATSSTDIPTVNFTNTRSIEFDASGDFVSVDNQPSLEPSNYSISFWTKNNSTPSNQDGIICMTNGSFWSDGWGFYYESSTEIRFFVGKYWQNFSSGSINPLQWTNVIGTFDGSAIRVYVNGVEGSSGSYAL